MEAKFMELNNPPKFKVSDRKEKYFCKQYSAVVFNGKAAYDAVTLRVYATDSRHYCCVWVHGNCSWNGCAGDYWRSGSGNAGGYGYHRASAAACEAIHNAGIELDEDINGRGDSAIREAVEVIAKTMYRGEGYYIHITEAHA